MHCRSCEILIEESLKAVPGIKTVDISYKDGRAKVGFDGPTPSKRELAKAVQNAGYEIGQKEKLPWVSRNASDYKYLLLAGLILAAVYFVGRQTGLFNINVASGNGGMGVVFVVGLVAGISSCMALIGGLVLGLSARHAELHPEATPAQKFRPHLYFNIGRILGYGVFGGAIGLLGSAFSPSASTLGIMTIVVGVVMIFLGLKLVEIFPALKDKTLTLPKFISKSLGITNDTKEYSHRGAFISGALTFFLPCGFTQAMQLFAVSTGSFTKGSLIMFLFALGTAPGLLGVGGLSSIFKGRKAKVFFMTAGLAVIILGVFNISNASRLVIIPSWKTFNSESVAAYSGPPQEVRMEQNEYGYSPRQFTVIKDRPVKWIINSTNQYSCASYIIMSEYKISEPLKPGENIIEFVPKKTGDINFTCSMGMYRGKFSVVEAAKVNVEVPSELLSPEKASPQALPSRPDRILKSVYRIDTDIVPNEFTVKAGQLVRMEVDVKDLDYGCMSTIMIPGLYNEAELLVKDKIVVMEFTPKDKGEYPITCAMGVERGILRVE